MCYFCNMNLIPKYSETMSLNMGYLQIVPERFNKIRLELSSDFNNSSMYIQFCPVCGKNLINEQSNVKNTEQNDYTMLPERIKDKMEQNGISLCQLAKDTGVARSTLSNYLNGKVKDLAFVKLMTVLKYLDIDIS